MHPTPPSISSMNTSVDSRPPFHPEAGMTLSPGQTPEAQSVPELLVESRLISAVSCVLSIQKQSITLIDSFTDLGGDEQSAHALRSLCMAAGLGLSTDDILGCQTLAELQTHITPLHTDFSTDSDDSSAPPVGLPQVSPRRSREDGRQTQPADTVLNMTSTSTERDALEALILSAPRVSGVAVIKPRAGFLEEKRVAFISLGTTDDIIPYGLSSVHVVSQSQMHNVNNQVAAIRLALESSNPQTPMPDNWIVLDHMPVNSEGQTDRRRLQTWAQNMNEETYQQVTSLESEDILQDPVTEIERTIQKAASRALRLPERQIGMNLSFTQLGGDEVSAMLLVAACRTHGILVCAVDTLQSNSLAQLASLASYRQNDLHQLWNEDSVDDFKLSPMQQLYFDTATGGRPDARAAADGSYRFNQSRLLRIKAGAALDDVHAAVQTLVGHHSMLRARFVAGDDGWTQRIVPEVDGSYGFGHHNVRELEDVLPVVEQAQENIDIEKGPVFAVEYFRTRDGQQMVFLIAHQLVIDHMSWRVLTRDLDELLTRGTLCSERSMPFWVWNELQEQEIAKTAEPSPLPFALTPCDFESWGLRDSLNTYNESSEVSFTINPELTDILHTTCTRVLRMDAVDIYVAALHLAFTQTFTNRQPPTIWNQELGREPWNADIDIAETVGWLTNLCPVGLRSEPSNDLLHVLRDIKDTRRAIPGHGWTYFASRFFGPFAATRCAEGWPFEIIFNYLGSNAQSEREDSALECVKVPGQSTHSASGNFGPAVTRLALFEVNVSVEQGAATVEITYNRLSNQQGKIAEWIQAYEHFLYEAIGRLRYRAQELTLADVPLLDVDYHGLTKLNVERLIALGLSSAREVEDVLPATNVQQDIIISQGQCLSNCHNFVIHQLTFENGTKVDHAHICRVWEYIVAKHPALRTVLIDSIREDALFDQVVLKRCSPNMLFFEPAPGEDPIQSLRALPSMASTPGQPRHRLSICTSPTGTFLKVEVSQVLCDVPSLQLLMCELKRNYNSAKMPMNMLDPPHRACVQYLQTARRQDSRQFWQNHLQDTDPCLFPRLGGTSDTRDPRNHFDLDISLAETDEFCRKYTINRGTIVRVAWGLVLRVFTNSNRVCFGFRAAGRDSYGAPNNILQSVGCFENTIPCSLNLWAYQSLEAIVRDAEDDFSVCLPHQHVCPSELEHAIGLKGKRLFNTCVSYVEAPPVLKSRFCSSRPQMGMPCVQLFSNPDYDLALMAMFVNGHLVCDISHRWLTSRQASSVMGAFGAAMKAILRNPFATVGGLCLSPQDDQLLHGSARLDLLEPCVHSLFNNQARKTPESPAVCAGDGDFSYRALARMVQRLAAHLTQRGVRPGVPVAVVLGRTKWSVVSILAVLKSGGCFVPIDGEDPHMVEAVMKEVDPRVILVTENVSSNLNLFVDGVVFVNEALFAGQMVVDAPTRRASGDDVACILFPAGSSRSKELRGFMYSHVALSSSFLAQGKPLGLNEDSRVLQISSFSVDTSLTETLTTLTHGGCVCIPTPAERRSDMVGAIRRMGANWTYMTPIIARKLQPSSVPSVKVVCFRTRGLDEDTCAPWLRRVRVLLAYGCLEICPLGISVLEVTRPEQLAHIAQPFLGKCWVANPDDPTQQVPVGAIGELCIESPAIAHRFVAGNPLKPLTQFNDRAMEDGRKMVRFIKTSQSVRCVDDGTLELILSPRRDMNFNGRVIPAAKVEMHLRRCLGAGLDVAVESVTSRDNDQVLAAFIQLDKTWKGPENLSCLDVSMRDRAYFARHFSQTSLRDILPPHMIPSVFIPVRRLPVTSAMKVNRRRLQKLASPFSKDDLLAISDDGASNSDNGDHHFKPLPLTQVEEQMRSIWSELLEINVIDIEPSAEFTRLGGGFYLAKELVIRCRRQGLYIDIHNVLRGASLTELCQGITLHSDASLTFASETADSTSSAEVDVLVEEQVIETTIIPRLGVDRKDIKDISLASSSQIRAIEVGMLKERASTSYLVLNFSNLSSVAKLEAACFGICIIHPILRSVFVRSGSQVYQVALRSESPEFQRIGCPAWRLGGLVEKVMRKDSLDAQAIGTLSTKFFFLDAGKQSTLIVRLTKAHYDDASIPLIAQDLGQLYAGARSPRRPTYFDFVRSSEIACHGAGGLYWKNLLQGADMTRIVDWTGPPTLASAVQAVQHQIQVTSLSGLGITFDTVAKAAWAIVLATISGSGDVVFGEVVDGRHIRLMNGESASGVVGPAQNTIPVRVRFGEEHSTPLDLLRSIHGQRTLSTAFENTGWLEIVRSSGRMPLWTRISTAVHHKHASPEPVEIKFDDASCHYSIQEPEAQDAYDLLVTTSMADSGKVDIRLSFCETRIPQTFAEETLKSLCSTIELLTSVSMTHPLIPSINDLKSMRQHLPFPEPRVNEASGQGCNDSPAAQQFALQSLIAAAWTRAVNPRELGVPESQLHKSAFYDLWGSLIPASEIAGHITRELPNAGIPGANGIQVNMEEVINNPTMIAQLDLVMRKMRSSDSPKRRITGSFKPGSSAYLGRSIRRLANHARGHGRAASEGSRIPAVSAVANQGHTIDSDAGSPVSSKHVRLDGLELTTNTRRKTMPVGGVIAEKDGEEIEGSPSVSLVPGPQGRPILTLVAHDGGEFGGGFRGSMESLTTGTSRSEDEVDDIVMPLGQGPSVARYSPDGNGEADLVSPITPMSKSPFDFQPGGAIGLGIQGGESNGAGSASVHARTSSMRKKASSAFGKMGLVSPVSSRSSA